MKEMGNKKLNLIWESVIPDGFERITSHSDRKDRIKWLTNKYVLGRFRDDYIPSGPKMFSEKEKKKEEMKNIFVESLQEDVSFRNNLVSLIFGFQT